MNAVAFPLFLAAGAGVCLALYSLRHRATPGAVWFLPLELACVVWLATAGCGALAPNLGAKLFWWSLTFLGSAPLPLLWLAFTLDFTGLDRLLTRRRLWALAAIPAISLLLVATNDLHGLVWRNPHINGVGILETLAGPWFEIVLVPYGWILVSLGIVALVGHYLATDSLQRGQCSILIAAAIIPLSANIVQVTGHSPVPGLDVTALAFCAATLLVGWGLFFYRFLDMVPVAFEAVFNSMGDGVVILDAAGLITMINPIGLERLGRTEEEVLGRRAHEVYEFWPEAFAQAGPTGEARTEVKIERHGRVRNVEMRAFPLYDLRGEYCGRVVISQDVTERNAYQRRVEEMAFRDFLTGLPNRRALHNAADKALALARRHHWGVALIFLDLDRFKNVNDALGHPAGDLLLQLVASRLESQVRREDLLARLGGDEFALLIQDCNVDDARHSAERLLQGLCERPFEVKDTVLQMDASIGIALYPQAGRRVDDLLARADIAMYQAKQGPSRISLYDANEDHYTQDQLELEREFRAALENGELLFKYQPFLDLDSGRVIAVEALLRWEHPSRGLTHPSVFLPMVEDRDLARQLDHHVLDRTLREMASLEIDLSVNLSTSSLLDPGLPGTVKAALSASGLEPRRLILEITERALAIPERVRPILVALRQLGVRVAADDFGTGYSSLAYLRHFPLNILKLDRYLISGIGSRVEDEAIIRAVIMIAKSMGLEIVAEGVETGTQLDWLRNEGCHMAQGFHIARPLHLEDLVSSELLRPRHASAPAEAAAVALPMV